MANKRSYILSMFRNNLGTAKLKDETINLYFLERREFSRLTLLLSRVNERKESASDYQAGE